MIPQIPVNNTPPPLPVPPPAIVLYQQPGQELSVLTWGQAVLNSIVAQGGIIPANSQPVLGVQPSSELPINPAEETPTGPGGQTWLPWYLYFRGATPPVATGGDVPGTPAVDVPDPNFASVLGPGGPGLEYTYQLCIGIAYGQMLTSNAKWKVNPDGSLVKQ